MKKLIFVCGLSFLFSFFAVAQQDISVDSDFVTESEKSSYEEWTGGYAPEEINTAQQIMDIGRRLGNGIRYQESVENDPQPYNKGNPAYKYSAARVYGKNARGADLILIGHTATVDTIKCLKMIIRGYLETAFGTSREDAIRLAEFICYWNTNNYGNTNYFASGFESEVLSVFDGRYDHVGLSNSYKDWKGSILVIPHVFAGAPVEEVAEAPETEAPEIDSAELGDESSEKEAEAAAQETVVEEPYVAPVQETYNNRSYDNQYSRNQYNRNNSRAAVSKKKSLFDTTTLILLGCALVAVIAIVIVVIAVTSKKQEY